MPRVRLNVGEMDPERGKRAELALRALESQTRARRETLDPLVRIAEALERIERRLP